MNLVFRYKSARLLTREEWEHILSTVPNVPVQMSTQWWTSSYTPAKRQGITSLKAVYVSKEGTCRNAETHLMMGIRPLFVVRYFEDLYPDTKVGDKMRVGDTPGTIVDIFCPTEEGDPVEAHVLADNVVCLFKDFNGADEYLGSEGFKQTVLGAWYNL